MYVCVCVCVCVSVCACIQIRALPEPLTRSFKFFQFHSISHELTHSTFASSLACERVRVRKRLKEIGRFSFFLFTFARSIARSLSLARTWSCTQGLQPSIHTYICIHTYIYKKSLFSTKRAISSHLRSFVAVRHTGACQQATTRCNALQCTATHCNTLQHTATHSNTLQHTASHTPKLVFG